MNWEEIQGDWDRFRKIIRLHWSKITERQLDSVAGKRERLVEVIQAAYRMSRGNADRELGNWQASASTSVIRPLAVRGPAGGTQRRPRQD